MSFIRVLAQNLLKTDNKSRGEKNHCLGDTFLSVNVNVEREADKGKLLRGTTNK